MYRTNKRKGHASPGLLITTVSAACVVWFLSPAGESTTKSPLPLVNTEVKRDTLSYVLTGSDLPDGGGTSAENVWSPVLFQNEYPFAIKNETGKLIAYVDENGDWHSQGHAKSPETTPVACPAPAPAPVACPATKPPELDAAPLLIVFGVGMASVGLPLAFIYTFLKWQKQRQRRLYGEKPLTSEGEPLGWRPRR